MYSLAASLSRQDKKKSCFVVLFKLFGVNLFLIINPPFTKLDWLRWPDSGHAQYSDNSSSLFIDTYF